jgi:hypothetical protein
MVPKTLSDPETECLKLKKEINENHRLAQKAAGDAVERALLTGELLQQWKALLPHGKFESFVETHFEGSLRTAQTYMQAAKRLNELSKAQRTALLKDELSIVDLLEFPKNGAVVVSGSPPAGTRGGAVKHPAQSQDARPDSISAKGKPGGEQRPSSTPTPVSPGPASGEAADSSNDSGGNVRTLGKCPNCAGTRWTQDEFGATCAKCHHPHGEARGDADEDRVDTQRSKTVKTVEALMRAFDDLNMLLAKPDHPDAIAQCKFLLTIARAWK